MYFWMQSGCRPRLQYTYVRWSREITVQTSSLLTLALHPLLITAFQWSVRVRTIGTALWLWCERTRCFAPRRLTFTWSECPNAADRDTTVIRSTFISQSSPHFQLTLEVQLTSGQVREQSDRQVICVFGRHLTVTFQYSKVTKQTEVTAK